MSTPHEERSYYKATELTPNDVLFGRGAQIQRYRGNESFRRHVATRRAAYAAAGHDNVTKQRIAAQVVRHIREGCAPPGRFLKRVDKDEVLSMGYEQDVELWTEAEEGMVVEKAKQLLRDKSPAVKGKRRAVPVDLGTLTDDVGGKQSTSGVNPSASASPSPSYATSQQQHRRDIDSSFGEGGSSPWSDAAAEVRSASPILLGGASVGNLGGNLGDLDLEDATEEDIANIIRANVIASDSASAAGGGIGQGGSMGGTGDASASYTAPEVMAYHPYQQHLQQQQQHSPACDNTALLAPPPSLSVANDGLHFSNNTLPMGDISESQVMPSGRGGGDDFLDRIIKQTVPTLGGTGNDQEVAASSANAAATGMPAAAMRELALGRTTTADGSIPSQALALAEEAADPFEPLHTFPDASGSNSEVSMGSLHTSFPADPSVNDNSAVASGIRSMGPLRASTTSASTVTRNEALASTMHLQLLQQVKIALGVVGTVAMKHKSAAAIGDESTNEGTIAQDLRDLGFVLQQHFAGIDTASDAASNDNNANDVDDKQDRTKRRHSSFDKRRQSSGGLSGNASQSDVLMEAGLPVSLCLLITSLLDATNDDAPERYVSSSQVEEDMQQMVSNPARYLFDPPQDRVTGRLSLPAGKMYGREQHLTQLCHAFNGVMNGAVQRSLALVIGPSGSGKSSLVEQLRGPLHEKNGRMIWCKFEPMDQSQSMSLIIRAFNEYCKNLLAAENLSLLIQIRKELRVALGDNASALTDLMPDLKAVFGPMAVSTMGTAEVGARNALDRFLHYFRIFRRTISASSHPIVFVFDDLQWADSGSIELISTLIRDPEMRSLLSVGIYRDDEVGVDHPFTAEMVKIASARVGVTTIKLGDLDTDSTNELVSDALILPPRVTRGLSTIIHTRTGGNPLAVIEFLSALVAESMLQYSAISRRWEWDAEEIQLRVIAGTTVQLLSSKMEKLPHQLKWILRVSACFGTEFQASTIKLLDPHIDRIGSNSSSGDDGDSAPSLFQVLVEEGYIIDAGSSYRFAHDAIQEAAYDMTPPSEQSLFHLAVGRLLLKQMPSADNLIDDQGSIYDIVGQLNRGLDLVDDESERLQIAELNLIAGENSASIGAFTEASMYLLTGTSIVRDDDWESHYSLCLRMYTLCSELMFVVGNNDEAVVASRVVLANARVFDDKIMAYMSLIQSLGGKDMLDDAIKCGVEFLGLLGEPLPSQVAREDVVKEFLKTKAMLEEKLELLGGDNDIVQESKVLEDDLKINAMKVLIPLMRYCFVSKPVLAGMIIARLMQITLEHGICNESSYAFAAFATQCCKFNEFDLAATCARTAKSLLSRSGDMYFPNVCHLLYASTNSYKEPLQACGEQFLRGYEVGIGVGNIEFALSCLSHHTSLCILAPKRNGTLAEAVSTMAKNMSQAKTYEHRTATFALPFLQTALSLMGDQRNRADPTILMGHGVTEEELIEETTKKKQFLAATCVHTCRLWLKYSFRRYDGAEEIVTSLLSCKEKTPFLSAPEKISIVLYLGLMATHLARETRKEQYRDIAVESLDQMKTMASIGCEWNFENKVKIMEAELAYCDKDHDAASRAYDDAITSAEKHGFLHEQALAAERAGLFYAETASRDLAAPYFEQALTVWESWGAQAKADDLKQLLLEGRSGEDDVKAAADNRRIKRHQIL